MQIHGRAKLGPAGRLALTQEVIDGTTLRQAAGRFCHMAFFADPDGNALTLHHRYAPRVTEA